MPIRIEQWRSADRIQLRALLSRQHQVNGGQVIAELGRGAAANNDRGHASTPQEPSQRNLGTRYAAPFGDWNNFIDNAPQAFLIADRRLDPVCQLPRSFGCRLIAPVFARQEPARERAPDQNPEALVERDRYQLILHLARLQRIVDLLADETLTALICANPQRFHQMPRRRAGATDIADLAVPDEAVERPERFVRRGQPIPLMYLVEIDHLCLHPLQARLALSDDMIARHPPVIGARPHIEPDLGRQQEIGWPRTAQNLADDFLRNAVRIDVRGVDQIDAGVEAKMNLLARILCAGIADRGEIAAAAKRHRAHGDRRDLEARSAKLPIFHRQSFMSRRRKTTTVAILSCQNWTILPDRDSVLGNARGHSGGSRPSAGMARPVRQPEPHHRPTVAPRLAHPARGSIGPGRQARPV